ncbi:MAG: GNAT family N-acetyltransferase [Halobacteriaceae archaeon]
MEFALLGWPADGPTLRLDHREFAYAGKFVMSNTGKAVAREGDAVVAAVSFNADRTDDDTAWLRYVTVREDRRGEGVGPRLVAFATERLHERFDVVRIAVNNPFAFEALHKAGFGWTGTETGIAELILEHPGDPDRYEDGLAVFAERDLSSDEEAFLAERSGPPATLDPEAY